MYVTVNDACVTDIIPSSHIWYILVYPGRQGCSSGRNLQPVSLSTLSLATPRSLLSPFDTIAGYLQDKRKAQQAAYRRAADLLRACGAASQQQGGSGAFDGAYEGTLGLTRKLHYTGYVQVGTGGCYARWAAG